MSSNIGEPSEVPQWNLTAIVHFVTDILTSCGASEITVSAERRDDDQVHDINIYLTGVKIPGDEGTGDSRPPEPRGQSVTIPRCTSISGHSWNSVRGDDGEIYESCDHCTFKIYIDNEDNSNFTSRNSTSESPDEYARRHAAYGGRSS